MKVRGQRRFLIAALWVIGALLLSQGLYMDAKAKAAQALIAMSWGHSHSQRGGDLPPPKPWWWADTRAIAKMSVPRLNKHLYIMQDDSGESLAFGPGHLPASAKPSNIGHVMIAGHRDSHFNFLRKVRVGDVIETQNYRGQKKSYQIQNLHIIDSDKQGIELLDSDHLTLITCYPFDSFVPGGPLRFLVEAEIIEGSS